MKRRKIIGLVLIVVTFVYFVACLLALYQNQRVKMEKGVEEALKAYSNHEGINIKELSEDFNIRLDEKMDANEGRQQILKFEGSFERMEKNIINVNDEMAKVEVNITNLNDRLDIVENFYEELYIEITSKYDLYEEQFLTVNQNIQEIVNIIDEIKVSISDLEEKMDQNNMNQDENMKELQSQLDDTINRLAELRINALLYSYDENTQTLHVYGDKEEE